MNGLEPVVAALRASADADASAVSRDAADRAATSLAAARDQAAQILARAREAGECDARAAITAERMRVRRQARTLVLTAHRAAYERLRAAARDAARRWAEEPGNHDALVRAATRVLGPRARLREAPGGGIVAEHAGRRLDLSVDTIADRAVDELRIGPESPARERIGVAR